MTIKELIEELQKYDENMTVKVFDSGSGNVDVTEIYQHEGIKYGALQGMPHKVTYVCIV